MSPSVRSLAALREGPALAKGTERPFRVPTAAREVRNRNPRGPRIDRLLKTAERRLRGDGTLCGIEDRVAVELTAGNGSGKSEKSNAKQGTKFVLGTFRA